VPSPAKRVKRRKKARTKCRKEPAPRTINFLGAEAR